MFKTKVLPTDPVVFSNEHLFNLDVHLQLLGYKVYLSYEENNKKMKRYVNEETSETILLGEQCE